MTRISRLFLGPAALGLAFVGMTTPAPANFTYDVSLSATSPVASPATVSVVGTITVDKLGILLASDVVDYSLTFSSPNLPSSTLTAASGTVLLFGSASLNAGISALTVTLPADNVDFDAFEIVYQNQQNVSRSFFFSTSTGSTVPNLFVINYQPVPGGGSIVGTTTLSYGGTYVVGVVVPEPSSLALCGIASLLGLGYVKVRRPNRPRSAVAADLSSCHRISPLEGRPHQIG